MADAKGIQDFPEVKGKIVDRVEFSTHSDYFAIDISLSRQHSACF